MLAPSASRPRLLVLAAAAVALCASVLLLALLQPRHAASSQLSAARFFSRVNPELASLMSPHAATQADAVDVDSPLPPAHSSSFYSDVSSSLGRLMRRRAVLTDDAAEVQQQQLPYDEAAALGVPVRMSSSSFQHVAAAVQGWRQGGGAAGMCHACVRAAAAAAKAKAQAAAEARAAKAARDMVQAARRKQRGDAAAATADIARQTGVIAKLRDDPSFPAAAMQPMQQALRREQARWRLQALRDAAAVARASRRVAAAT